MKRFIYLYFTIGLCLLLIADIVGCKKFVQIPDAKNKIPASTVFADSTDATSAVLGMYTYITRANNTFNLLSGGITNYTGLSADELKINTNVPDELQFYRNGIVAASNSTENGLWSEGYTVLYQANACIEGLTASTGLSANCKNQLLGEAKFIRALLLFNLTNLFGDIPLVTSTDYQTNATLPRASSARVYQQITSDLTSCQTLLKTNYPSAGKVRANYYAATALLARVYLYTKQWTEAVNASTQVINNGGFSLETNLNNVFLAGSKEAILQIIPGTTASETAEGNLYIPSSASVIPSRTINNFLLAAFEVNDQRKSNWLKFNTVSGVTYYYPFKYQYRNDNLSKNYVMILRLTEQYLIRAEAQSQQGTDLTGAANDLNIVRTRAGLGTTTASTSSTLLTAIYHERQVELFAENGHRWFDLKRTGQVDAVMGTGGVCAAKGGTWDSNWALYPVPYTQIQANPFLVQNPGY